jgi:2-succinyl-5-enolpyruvyl-6-hydroxy-3-cyclohexene-1-carboxylate synthase
MEQYYSNERNVQILVSLLKQHGIKRVVVSPGSTSKRLISRLDTGT